MKDKETIQSTNDACLKLVSPISGHTPDHNIRQLHDFIIDFAGHLSPKFPETFESGRYFPDLLLDKRLSWLAQPWPGSCCSLNFIINKDTSNFILNHRPALPTPPSFL